MTGIVLLAATAVVLAVLAVWLWRNPGPVSEQGGRHRVADRPAGPDAESQRPPRDPGRV